MNTKTSHPSLRNSPTRVKQKGISVVELLIGVLIGLFITGGAFSLFLSHLDSSRRMFLEARLHQDLRAAADIVTRDLRRAGHWTDALQGITGNTSNPNRNISSTSSTVTYRLDTPSASGQQVIFSLSDGKIRLKLGAGDHQDITDPQVMTVTEFTITPQSNTIDLSNLCANPCSGAGCPNMVVRRYDIAISAQSASDARITRQLNTSVKVRNDDVSGVCPT